MIDREYVKACVDNFNMRLDTTKEEVRKEDGSFEHAIANLTLGSVLMPCSTS